MDRSSTDPLTGAAPIAQRSTRRRLAGIHLRAGVVTAAAVLLLLVVLDGVLYAMLAASAEHVLADSPRLAGAIKDQARLQLVLFVLASFLFLAGIAAVEALEGHRTAGATRKLARCLGGIERGRYDTRLELRRDDHMQPVQDAFNRMAQALRDRTLHEVETLERLADHAGADPSLGIDLRQLAARMRRSVDGLDC